VPPAFAAQAAGWPRLAAARGSQRHPGASLTRGCLPPPRLAARIRGRWHANEGDGASGASSGAGPSLETRPAGPRWPDPEPASPLHRSTPNPKPKPHPEQVYRLIVISYFILLPSYFWYRWLYTIDKPQP